VGFEKAGDDLGGDQRVVPGKDEDRLRRFDQGQSGAHSAAGAVGLRLHDRLDVGGQAGRDVDARRHNRRHPARAGLTRSKDRPGDQRPPADGVEHLRRRRAHSRALAGRHDEH
jgi:hypothetical protein